MSWKASAYIKELVVCPNGERITRSEKLLALVLADYHQVGEPTYPSIPSLAQDSLLEERQARRLLDSLERKGVLLREYPENQGRGAKIFYRFPGIDSKPRTEAKTGPQSEPKGGLYVPPSAETKGGHPDPLSEPGKGGQKEDILEPERRAEGGQKGDILPRAYIEEQEQEQSTNKELPPVTPAAGLQTPKQDPKQNLKDDSHMLAKAVLDDLGLTGMRIYEPVRVQAELEMRVSGIAMEALREVMVGAWREYETCAKAGKLRGEMLWAERFFGDGRWKSPRLWGLKKGMKAYEGVLLGT